MVTVDIRNVLANRIGPEYGLTMEEIARLAHERPPSVVSARKNGAERPAFTYSAEQPAEDLDMIQRECDEFRASFAEELSDVLVLGIGGSALGARALKAALLHPYHDLLPESERSGPRLHVQDNVDPAAFAAQLEILDPARTAIIAISKSGTTAETRAEFSICRDWLTDNRRDWRKQSIAITNQPDARGYANPLWTLAEQEGIRHFGMPVPLGGRFSVLSPVGLVPAALTGMDIHGLVQGAADMYAACEEEDWQQNPALRLAAACYLFLECRTECRRNICVLMPYSEALSLVGDWFIQLWAESLGKRYSADGRQELAAGQQPVKALGATDQHSQLQLYQEGPQDKLIMFIEVEDCGADVRIPPAGPGEPEYLGGRSLAALLSAEKRGTEFALTEARRPNLTIRTPKVDAHSVGGLFFLFWMQTAMMAEWLGVNAYDQPGVEASKDATRAVMGAPGTRYDEIRERMGAGL